VDRAESGDDEIQAEGELLLEGHRQRCSGGGRGRGRKQCSIDVVEAGRRLPDAAVSGPPICIVNPRT
jgi:hypothetical protein